MCLDDGRTELATVVNHIKPLARGGEDVDDNTENLCARHDAEVTARQFGQAAPIEARGVAVDGRPTSPDHPWNRARR
jgi:5-methylcytosine-specific restriction enzyme A